MGAARHPGPHQRQRRGQYRPPARRHLRDRRSHRHYPAARHRGGQPRPGRRPRRVLELPQFAGNAMDLVHLAPGTINGTNLRLRKAGFNSAPSTFSTDGGGNNQNEFSIDGVSNTYSDGTAPRVAFSPPQFAISEFKIQTSTFDAALGHTMGSTVNVSIKSGTNQLHGETARMVPPFHPGCAHHLPEPFRADAFHLPGQPLRRFRRRPGLHPERLQRQEQDLLVRRLRSQQVRQPGFGR